MNRLMTHHRHEPRFSANLSNTVDKQVIYKETTYIKAKMNVPAPLTSEYKPETNGHGRYNTI